MSRAVTVHTTRTLVVARCVMLNACVDDDVHVKTLPRVLLEWAAHHVGAFVDDDDCEEHVICTDYDGNQLSVDARRAIHEEARRRHVRAKSVDANDGSRAVALTRDGVDENPAKRNKVYRDEDVADECKDGEEEFARWAEMHGYTDMRTTPFDVYDELKISKESTNPAGRARATYHTQSLKWHPSETLLSSSADEGEPTSRGFCDSCQCVLQFGRWFHAHVRGERGRDFCSTCVKLSKRVTGREYDRRFDAGPLVINDESILVKSMEDLESDREAYESSLGSGVTKAVVACQKLQRLGIAFSVFKDIDRFRLYKELGWDALVKSERHSESDIFDLDGFTVYDRFFAGEDEDDRQYLLLCPEAESDVDTTADEADDVDDEAEVEKLLESGRDEIASAPRKSREDFNGEAEDEFPRPPIAAVLADPHISVTPTQVDDDVWKNLAKRLGDHTDVN